MINTTTKTGKVDMNEFRQNFAFNNNNNNNNNDFQDDDQHV